MGRGWCEKRAQNRWLFDKGEEPGLYLGFQGKCVRDRTQGAGCVSERMRTVTGKTIRFRKLVVFVNHVAGKHMKFSCIHVFTVPYRNLRVNILRVEMAAVRNPRRNPIDS